MGSVLFRWLMQRVFAKDYAAMRREYGVDGIRSLPLAHKARSKLHRRID